jgi:hypothetical protein
MSQRTLNSGRLMRKIAHLSRDFEASVTLCPICKNYHMIQLPKFIQGHIHPKPHIPKKRATTTDCHSGKLVCHHLRQKHKINNQQHHEEITGMTIYIYYVNCTSLTMSSRTETYTLLRCCLYGRAGYFQPVI